MKCYPIYKISKKGIFTVLVLISVLLLFVGCGQENAQQTSKTDSAVNSSESEIITASEAVVQNESVSPTITETEQTQKITQVQTAAVKESSKGTVKTQTPAPKPKQTPTQIPEKSEKPQNSDKPTVPTKETLSEPEQTNAGTNGENQSNLDSGLEQIKNKISSNLQGLVSEGTITQEQSDKVVEALLPNGVQGIKKDDERARTIDNLVKDGIITQEQADAVLAVFTQ